jgi:hypothetical protein
MSLAGADVPSDELASLSPPVLPKVDLALVAESRSVSVANRNSALCRSQNNLTDMHRLRILAT